MKKTQKKKPYIQVAIFGTMSIVSYFLLFSHQEIVTDYSTRGALFAALPVAMAFYFSFIHGTFASSVLSLLGIEAKKRKES